jgi:hypothetical protein
MSKVKPKIIDQATMTLVLFLSCCFLRVWSSCVLLVIDVLLLLGLEYIGGFFSSPRKKFLFFS